MIELGARQWASGLQPRQDNVGFSESDRRCVPTGRVRLAFPRRFLPWALLCRDLGRVALRCAALLLLVCPGELSVSCDGAWTG